MKKEKRPGRGKRFGLIGQIYILVAVSILLIGVVTYLSQYQIASHKRKENISSYVRQVAGAMIDAVKEYPAYKWLLAYWYDHASELDIEYDVTFTGGTQTEEKTRLLIKHHPQLPLRYATQEDIEAMSPEDQKLFAEICYSWLITHINEIKKNFHTDYLYCVVTDSDLGQNPYGEQFFLLSAADPGAKRGTTYKEVYTLGKVVDTAGNDRLQNAMRDAVERARYAPSFAKKPFSQDDSGDYIDEYVFLEWVGTHPALVGISFNLETVLADVRSQTWSGTLYAMLYQFLLVQLIMLHIFLYFISPLKKVAQSIRGYTENKDSRLVRESLAGTQSKWYYSRIIRQNEIGQLTDDIIDLTGEMDDHIRRIEKITADKKRIEVELDVASKIQEQMLPDPNPSFPGHSDVDLCASMRPAKEVGGDFYDYFMVDDDHLALVVADVSSKGVPAALFMVIAKTLIKNRAQMGESPGQLLYSVNNELNKRNETGYFVTVWLAVIELSTGNGVAANAGHEHPVICRNGGEFELVIYKHSPCVGVIEDIPFREHTFHLDPGDRVFVYTDGVPEATNPQQELFGTARMLESLNRNRNAPNAELMRRLHEDIDTFAGEADQFDDITMLSFWYAHTPASGPGSTEDALSVLAAR